MVGPQYLAEPQYIEGAFEEKRCIGVKPDIWVFLNPYAYGKYSDIKPDPQTTSVKQRNGPNPKMENKSSIW